MRIGIDIRTLMDKHYSGVPEYTSNLVKEILRLDKKNEYKLFYNSGKDVSGRIPDFAGSNVKIISTGYPNKIFNFVMQKTSRRPKIDQLLKVDLFFMPHINFVALSNKCKSVLTIHDLSFLPASPLTSQGGPASSLTSKGGRYPEFFSLRKNFWHKMINVKKLVRRFDKIIAVSENTKNDIVELCGVSPEKVKVIYSAVDMRFRKVDREHVRLPEVKEKYGLPDKFILYLGNLEPRKNIRGIIQAYSELRAKNKELKEVKLAIVGSRGWKSKNIFKAWQESRYKDDIKFLGYVPAVDKIYLYNLATLFVYPSFYEGFGFPPLEAMACGTPVVTSFASSLPEIVGDAAIMVDPYNIADIAGAMEQVLISRGLQNDLIKKGLEQARRFSWKKTAKEYLEVFKGFG